MPVTERKISRYGWKRDLPDPRDRIVNLERPILQAHRLPVKHSLREEMPPVYDQGQLGSCTANAIAGLLEHAATRQGEPSVVPSRLFIYYEERAIEGTVDQDAGAMIRDGIKVVASEGAPPEEEWPYDIARFADRPTAKAYQDAKQHEAIDYLRVIPGGRGAPIRTTLLTEPIAFGFSVPDYFEGGWDPTGQPLPLPTVDTQFIGGHAVDIVGYDFSRQSFPGNVLEVRNSWGPGWGDSGYYWMDAGWFDPRNALCDDFWTVSKVS